MADIDIDPFGVHESRTDETMGESIPLDPREGASTWEPECEQETSFGGGRTQEGRLTTSDATHYDSFRREGRWLYFRGKDDPLTNEDGKLRTIGQLKKILGVERICALGFDLPIGTTAKQAVALNKAKEEMPSISDIAKADDIELQEITENV